MIVRPFDIVMIGILLGAAAWTFKVKNDSETALARIEKLERDIAREREAIDILRADWSLLTSPDRLERLARRHSEQLGLAEARPEQFVPLSKVPAKPAELPRPVEQRNANAVPGVDPDLRTGAIGSEAVQSDRSERLND